MTNRLAVLLTMSLLLFSGTIYAFDNKLTHRKLTELATQNSHINNYLTNQLGISDYDQKLQIENNNFSIIKWFREGSYEEDKPACRASNHFHNPLLPWDQAGLTDNSLTADYYCQNVNPSFTTKYSNLVWATGIESPGSEPTNPANNQIYYNNGRNWSVARNLFYSALTNTNSIEREAQLAETFKTLGYVLHLLQDTAVPLANQGLLTL